MSNILVDSFKLKFGLGKLVLFGAFDVPAFLQYVHSTIMLHTNFYQNSYKCTKKSLTLIIKGYPNDPL